MQKDNLKSKDGVSLFTNNNKYVPPMTSDIVAGGVVEGNKMKKKLTNYQKKQFEIDY